MTIDPVVIEVDRAGRRISPEEAEILRAEAAVLRHALDTIPDVMARFRSAVEAFERGDFVTFHRDWRCGSVIVLALQDMAGSLERHVPVLGILGSGASGEDLRDGLQEAENLRGDLLIREFRTDEEADQYLAHHRTKCREPGCRQEHVIRRALERRAAARQGGTPP